MLRSTVEILPSVAYHPLSALSSSLRRSDSHTLVLSFDTVVSYYLIAFPSRMATPTTTTTCFCADRAIRYGVDSNIISVW